MSKIQSILNKISSIGLETLTSDREIFKVKLLNQIFGIVLCTAAFLFFYNFICFGISKFLVINIATVLFSFLIFFLHHKNRIGLARSLASLSFPILVCLIIISDGGNSGESKIFILCTLLAFIQYEDQDRIRLFSFFFILFLAILSSFLIYHFGISQYDSRYILGDTVLTVASIFVVRFIVSFYQRSINEFGQQQTKLLKELKLKNEELQRFAYITSHDLKEPVKTIEGFAGLLKNSFSDKYSKDEVKFVDFIWDSAKRLSKMIDSILTFSKLDQDQIQMEKVAIVDVVSTFRESRIQLFQSNQVILQYENLPTLTGNKVLLSLLFNNLLENAIQYNESDRPTILISCQTQREYFVIKIKDNGIGIPDEYKEYVFEPFRRLHARSKFEGTGLGLSICKRIVEFHNGQISLESNQTIGVTVTILFPLSQRKNRRMTFESV